MSDYSRRNIIAAGAVAAAASAASAAHAATFGNPDRPPQGRRNLANAIAGQDPGPQNPTLAGQFPSFQDPPATDVAGMDLFWASFSNAHKRIQSGGWAREVTQADFAISEAVSGVNMRLGPGGVRELHWHQQAEWAVMTDGKCRITVLDGDGRAAVRDVKEGDLWYFPPGLPHSLQGIGTSGAEFTLVFDNGRASEFNTLMLTEWMAHTPPEILADNFGLPQSAFQNIPMDNLWIYQAKDPVPPLAEAQRAVASPLGEPEFEFTFSMGEMKANKVTRGGSVKIVDTRNFPISKTIAAALVTIKPGGLRELHWHPNADEWQYYIKGQARMTVFNTGPRAMTADFRAGDLGYVKKSFGHYVQNTGTEDLVFLEIFKADRFQEVSLAQWLACTPPELVAQHTNMDPSLIRQFSKARWDVLPA
ncbi:cupin domain-containing protein [Novosphingobium terrae]|uniref:cupin domain-containing protein n=1 Tax=Novosphingobium terrae TaxID=2726189 RepID=UPI00197DA011|nr:cupin domain-containing protein [Novosphingobium terrae]